MLRFDATVITGLERSSTFEAQLSIAILLRSDYEKLSVPIDLLIK